MPTAKQKLQVKIQAEMDRLKGILKEKGFSDDVIKSIVKDDLLVTTIDVLKKSIPSK